MAYYDNFAESDRAKTTSIGRSITRNQNKYFLKKIKQYLSVNPEEASLLEVGPGKGDFANMSRSLGFSYTGLEANHNMAEKLREDGFEIFEGFAPPLPDNGPYDVIFMNQVYEHMADRDAATTLISECHEKLKPGGLLVISSPEIRAWGVDFYAGDYTHNWPTSLYNTEQIVFDYNFKVLEKTLSTLNVRGFIFPYLVTYLTHFLYATGILGIAFGKKSYKVKTVLLPSFVIICQKDS